MRDGALLHLDLRRRKLFQELIQLPGTGQVQHRGLGVDTRLAHVPQVQRAHIHLQSLAPQLHAGLVHAPPQHFLDLQG